MKIERLEVQNYRQFKDLILDLIYPKGHDKEGLPLDKICIIGQSGTGKTNLLEIIRDKINNDKIQTIFFKEENFNTENIYFVSAEGVVPKDTNYKTRKISDEDQKLLDDFNILRDGLILQDLEENNMQAPYNRNEAEQYDKDRVDYKSNNPHLLTVSERIKKIDTNINIVNNRYSRKMQNTRDKDIIYLNNEDDSWEILKYRIDDYEQYKTKYKNELFNKILNTDYSKEESIKDMKVWEEENENILDNISSKLNTILNKFNLELTKIDKNQVSYDALTIKDLSNSKIIDYDNLSTGTKNIISTFIPLKIHNPTDSIILIDEPENSFYPDIQRQLTNLYMEVGDNNQLIMATHSPLIASSFEPWEVVELKFDKNNQIYRELYYKGDNHIDNYILDPRLLTWTSILTNIFDLKENSNFTFREEALMKYIRLEKELMNIKDKVVKREKFDELMKLSELLGLSDNEKN